MIPRRSTAGRRTADACGDFSRRCHQTDTRKPREAAVLLRGRRRLLRAMEFRNLEAELS